MRCPRQTRTAITRNPGELENTATRSWIDDRASLVDFELELVSRTNAESVSYLFRHGNLPLASNTRSSNITTRLGNGHTWNITDDHGYSSTCRPTLVVVRVLSAGIGRHLRLVGVVGAF